MSGEWPPAPGTRPRPIPWRAPRAEDVVPAHRDRGAAGRPSRATAGEAIRPPASRAGGPGSRRCAGRSRGCRPAHPWSGAPPRPPRRRRERRCSGRSSSRFARGSPRRSPAPSRPRPSGSRSIPRRARTEIPRRRPRRRMRAPCSRPGCSAPGMRWTRKIRSPVNRPVMIGRARSSIRRRPGRASPPRWRAWRRSYSDPRCRSLIPVRLVIHSFRTSRRSAPDPCS